ncbi:MAG: glycoside hydrolase family 88 protein [Planctomycetota bacterium]|nr:glycoside hydrolase family 88 protein [Planctomycetota bacterium]
MRIDYELKPKSFQPLLKRFFALSGRKIKNLEKTWDPAKGTPVFTVKGRYATRGWTEWTQGFQYGCQILQFEATGDQAFLKLGLKNTLERMAVHVSHVGVHDHGFNNVSTYGNLRRLMNAGRIKEDAGLRACLELALKVSGAVQAARWTRTADGTGFIHSFNGPQSLFSDTIRSLRVLALAHVFGHALMGENDAKISLLRRFVEHLENTLKYNVYYGRGRDSWDVRGRVVHESIFNPADGQYRCPSTQQGYSPFSTWTRGLAWILTGCAEQLEFLPTLPEREFKGLVERGGLIKRVERAARATADFLIAHTCADGIPMWDTGAPGLVHLPKLYDQPSQPRNPYEPVDSSAAAIAAQGYLRLGAYFRARKNRKLAARYTQAGLTMAHTLLCPPYLSEDPKHQGLLLHSIYHQPRGWDYRPERGRAPYGESSLWGDYHAMELAVMLQKLAKGEGWFRYFD